MFDVTPRMYSICSHWVKIWLSGANLFPEEIQTYACSKDQSSWSTYNTGIEVCSCAILANLFLFIKTPQWRNIIWTLSLTQWRQWGWLLKPCMTYINRKLTNNGAPREDVIMLWSIIWTSLTTNYRESHCSIEHDLPQLHIFLRKKVELNMNRSGCKLRATWYQKVEPLWVSQTLLWDFRSFAKNTTYHRPDRSFMGILALGQFGNGGIAFPSYKLIIIAQWKYPTQFCHWAQVWSGPTLALERWKL